LYVGINVSESFHFGLSAKVSAAAFCVAAPIFALYYWATIASLASLPKLPADVMMQQVMALHLRNGSIAAAALVLSMGLTYLMLQ
ncbi:hypothetical protein, partial [Undibacterium sp. 10I3]